MAAPTDKIMQVLAERALSEKWVRKQDDQLYHAMSLLLFILYSYQSTYKWLTICVSSLCVSVPLSSFKYLFWVLIYNTEFNIVEI
jgi:hypothetical protein